MRVHKDESRNLLFVLCFLIRTTHSAAMKNDATEIVYPHTAEDPGEDAPADEAALNRARSGGRGSESAARERAGECARVSSISALLTHTLVFRTREPQKHGQWGTEVEIITHGIYNINKL